jgi:hypothetical protein
VWITVIQALLNKMLTVQDDSCWTSNMLASFLAQYLLSSRNSLLLSTFDSAISVCTIAYVPFNGQDAPICRGYDYHNHMDVVTRIPVHLTSTMLLEHFMNPSLTAAQRMKAFILMSDLPIRSVQCEPDGYATTPCLLVGIAAQNWCISVLIDRSHSIFIPKR